MGNTSYRTFIIVRRKARMDIKDFTDEVIRHIGLAVVHKYGLSGEEGNINKEPKSTLISSHQKFE